MRININGELHDANTALIPVLDRGFLYGDSIYEVIRTYEGRPFALEEHLARFERSAKSMDIPLPDRAWLVGEIARTLQAGGCAESYCRIIVTRGNGPISLDPSAATDPLTVIVVQEFTPFPEAMFEQGVRAAIPSVRRNLRSAVDPAIKSGNYLNSILALGEARRAGFDDALMLDVEGRVTEATTSNVFTLRADGVLCTPRLETGILEGVTRGLVLQLAEQQGLPCEECDLYPDDLVGASEVMLTSTLREAMAVVAVGDSVVGRGRPGPMAARLRRMLHDYALESVRSEAH